jgi:hypothetical protein
MTKRVRKKRYYVQAITGPFMREMSFITMIWLPRPIDEYCMSTL